MPGFFTIHSKSSSNSSRGWPPVTTLIPSSSKDWAAGFSSKGFPSLTVTIAPSLSKRRAADSPDLAKPNTKTFLLANFEIVFIMYLFIHTTFYFTFFCENKKVISGFYFNCY